MATRKVKRFDEGGETGGGANEPGTGGNISGGGYDGDSGDYVTVSETTNSRKGTPAYNMAALHESRNPILGAYNNAVQIANQDQDKSATSNTYGYQNAQQARDAYDSFAAEQSMRNEGADGRAKGGMIKKYAKGGSVSSASSRGDGIAQRGKTKGRMC